MCPSTIRGSSMAHQLAFGRGGTRIQACTLAVRESHSALALESDSLAGLAGAGVIGDTIGITELCSTTTATCPTAESLSIVTTSIVQVDFMVEVLVVREVSVAPRMDSVARILAHSAGLIMEGQREAFHLAVSRASAEAFTEVVEGSTAVAEATDDSTQSPKTTG